MNDHTLYDADTGEALGPATDEQCEASDLAGPEGIILVDDDGAVMDKPDSVRGGRRVYTL